jgi:hypothetical protein
MQDVEKGRVESEGKKTWSFFSQDLTEEKEAVIKEMDAVINELRHRLQARKITFTHTHTHTHTHTNTYKHTHRS